MVSQTEQHNITYEHATGDERKIVEKIAFKRNQTNNCLCFFFSPALFYMKLDFNMEQMSIYIP